MNRTLHLFTYPLAVFLLFTYASLFYFDPLEPSYITRVFPEPLTQNPSGMIGQFIGSWLIFCFGYLGFFLPLFIFLFFLKLKSFRKRIHILVGLIQFFLTLLCSSVVMTCVVDALYVNPVYFASGGVVGSYLTAFLLPYFGELGILLLFLPLSVLLLPTTLDIQPRIIRPILKKITIFNLPRRSNKPKEEIPQKANSDFENEKKKSNFQPFKRPACFKKSQDLPLKSSFPQDDRSHLITRILLDFGVKGKVINAIKGPVVSTYEYKPDPGVRQSRIVGLAEDLALRLKIDAAIIQPMKNHDTIGIQVPNKNPKTVFAGDIFAQSIFKSASSPLTFGLGVHVDGEPYIDDLRKMPHLLLAGATGSGKSVGINTILCSILMKSEPREVKFILVDPKMLELSVYEGIPHLLMPVITEPEKAASALEWAVYEMERRYLLLQKFQARSIEAYNERISSKGLHEPAEPLPYIVIIIDELADLMLCSPKNVESAIQRLSQKARASGIHLVLATQRPSVDVITGVIKANLPCRISYQVVSKHDSRTILDQIGSEKLLGKGDLLFMKPGQKRLERIQGAFVSDGEVADLVQFFKCRSSVQYDKGVMEWIEKATKREESKSAPDPLQSADPKFAEACEIGKSQGMISASYIQRQLKIGYNRAARIVEEMEERKMVSAGDGVKPRKWLG